MIGLTAGADAVKKLKDTTDKERIRQPQPEALKPYGFKPGVSGNPKGCPKGIKHVGTIIAEIATQIQSSINRVEKQNNKNLLDHFVERAFSSDRILAEIMAKLMPDLIKGSDAGKPVQIVYVGIPLTRSGELPDGLAPEIRAAALLKMNGSNGASNT